MASLPEIDFCGTRISRLIIGGNPISGTSHQNADMDAQMEDYYTSERIKHTLRRCAEEGINTAQLRGDKHIARILREYRLEGGRINWIGQTAPEMSPYENSVRFIKNNGAFCMYHHGTVTDELFKAGEYAEIQRRLNVIRQTGLPVGLGSHMPEVLEHACAHHWDVDFFMCCVYNISKAAPGQPEPFDAGDPDIMYSFIRSTDKPCLAFKILGAGRNCASHDSVRAAFTHAFESIKPSDAVVVGMFPRDSDQVAENAAIVREVAR